MTQLLAKRAFMQGNEACAEAAILAGCRYFAGYPITPATEIAETLAKRMPEVGGVFIQMEDEIASITSVIGASWAGAKAMTATSGPGFSLMQEGIGLAVMTETPCVIVDVQRLGPCQGFATLPMQGDVMQARWGSHGDSRSNIVLAPSSPQEMFNLTIEAFNLAERFRTPAIVLSDEIVAHMRERVIIPQLDALKIENRRKPVAPTEDFRFHELSGWDVTPMPALGSGYKLNIVGHLRTEEGRVNIPSQNVPQLALKLLTHLSNKITAGEWEAKKIKTLFAEDSRTMLISYGSTSRTVESAVKEARKAGMKVGCARLVTLWPFPEEQLQTILEDVDNVIVVEMNLGQIVDKVREVVGRSTRVMHVPKVGDLHTTEELLDCIKKVAT
ncbi:MAG: 2-oxoacid:acceptor oxidoreductase subunit alpha [Candidatus Bathyarchaeia archaeon]